jgi:hypothetical protein
MVNMKKLIALFLSGSLVIFSPVHAQSLDDMQEKFDTAVGTCASDGIATGIGVSMMGWGLAIIVGISILSIVVHQSTSVHSAPATSQGGTGSGAASVL